MTVFYQLWIIWWYIQHNLDCPTLTKVLPFPWQPVCFPGLRHLFPSRSVRTCGRNGRAGQNGPVPGLALCRIYHRTDSGDRWRIFSDALRTAELELPHCQYEIKNANLVFFFIAKYPFCLSTIHNKVYLYKIHFALLYTQSVATLLPISCSWAVGWVSGCGWLIDWLIDWLIKWVCERVVDWLID